MRHKRYNKLVEIRSVTSEIDALGDVKRTGTDLVKEVWANVRVERREKTVQYGQVPVEGVIEIKMHNPKTFTVTGEHLVKHNGQLYSILSLESDERGKELTIRAKRYD